MSYKIPMKPKWITDNFPSNNALFIVNGLFNPRRSKGLVALNVDLEGFVISDHYPYFPRADLRYKYKRRRFANCMKFKNFYENCFRFDRMERDVVDFSRPNGKPACSLNFGSEDDDFLVINNHFRLCIGEYAKLISQSIILEEEGDETLSDFRRDISSLRDLSKLAWKKRDPRLLEIDGQILERKKDLYRYLSKRSVEV